MIPFTVMNKISKISYQDYWLINQKKYLKVKKNFLKNKIFGLELGTLWHRLLENEKRNLKCQKLRVIVNNNKRRNKQWYSLLNFYACKLLIN